ncbi:glutaminyl-peptide cyclotransferase [Haloglycomyces albus]|uniref:glutaminyl-peptide cyclotransferase n=1 Tax=Haloglycomyces albus TaxID=526067 RepID=UPI00046D4C7B|nr:glutaminyl-peptide cyclotransferase [Haloglycomyces albus]
MAKKPILSAVIAILTLTTACGEDDRVGGDDNEAEQLSVTVIDTRPHDDTAFTQGLELADGILYESTGQYGRSQVRTVDPHSGEVRDAVDLPDDEFGEGLTVTESDIWQLTWKSGVVYRRDRSSLEEVDTYELDGEGWGICAIAGDLYISDGSAQISVRDAETFAERDTMTVTLDGEPVDRINELECEGDTIWANVWQTPDIVGVDRGDGSVHTVVDAGDLEGEYSDRRDRTLNGIAAVGDGTYYLTGKEWPYLFHVSFA